MEFLTEESRTSKVAGQGIIVTKYYGPTVTHEMLFCDASSRRVVVPTNEVPVELNEILLAVTELATVVPFVKLSRGQQFIRTQKLSFEKAEQLRDAGLVVDVDNQQLARARFIEEGISYERRLILVATQDLY